MKYKQPCKSDKLSEVLGVVFEEPYRVKDVSEEIGQDKSTASRKLTALQKEDLVKQVQNYKYEANRDKIYQIFWEYLMEEIHFNEESDKQKFEKIKEEIRKTDTFRKHLLGFVQSELQVTSTPLEEIFHKYQDRLEIRHDFVYQLTHNDIENSNLSRKKKRFWKHLTIIQAHLPHSLWTETMHGAGIQSLLYPGEEENMEDIDQMWYDLIEKSKDVLDELAGE